MNRLRRNVVANVTGNAWSTVLSLLLTPVYIRLLGIESYGLIGFYMSWVAILGILDTGISATAVRETAWLAARPADSGRIPSLLRTLEVAYWAVMVVVGAALLVGAAWFGESWFRSAAVPPAAVRTALILMVLSLVMQVPSGLYVGGLMGLQRQVLSAKLLALFGTIRGAGAVAVIMLLGPDIRWFFVWQIAASVLQTGVIRHVLWRQVATAETPPRFSRAMLSSVRSYAGGMTLITGSSLLLTQADKLILSRLVSLEAFGFYMLAWTVASGLSRVTTPLMQAFAPRFTELASRGEESALGVHLRLATQVISVLILPPATLLVLAPEPILTLWIADPAAAEGAAPLLALMTVGTVLSACSYPALSVLYSRGRLAPVLATNLLLVAALLPVLWVAVPRFGATAAAGCWAVYGLTMYVIYHTFGAQRVPNVRALPVMAYDVLAPAAASFAVALVAAYSFSSSGSRLQHLVILAAAVPAGWVAALLVSRDLFRTVVASLRWKSAVAH